MLRVSVRVPEGVREPFEAAFDAAARSVEAFEEPGAETWRIAGLVSESERPGLVGALFLAAMAAGLPAPELETAVVDETDWLAATRASFPPLPIGERFLVLGSHHRPTDPGNRIALRLDAGLAFGTGEHATTRLCLEAFERLARRGLWRRVADMGAGSAILALAAVRVGRSRVLAAEIDAPSVRVARENLAANGAGGRIRVVLADGWRSAASRRAGPYDLVFANILARPLARMARGLAGVVRPGGRVILSGLLAGQARFVLAAHARQGFRLERRTEEAGWNALVLRAPGPITQNGTAREGDAVPGRRLPAVAGWTVRPRSAGSTPPGPAGRRAWPGRAG